jgi:hypothetical protein
MVREGGDHKNDVCQDVLLDERSVMTVFGGRYCWAVPIRADETSEAKQQFNISPPATLVRQVKHAAIDHSQSLSSFVADAPTRHLVAIDEDRT